MDAVTELIAAAIRIATPLLFATLGGILSERAGVFAVGLEGMMLTGAFAGVVATHTLGSAGPEYWPAPWAAPRSAPSSRSQPRGSTPIRW